MFFDHVLGPLCLARHTQWRPFYLKSAMSVISPSRVRDGDKVVAERIGREKYFPGEGSLIALKANRRFFSQKKETEKI